MAVIVNEKSICCLKILLSSEHFVYGDKGRYHTLIRLIRVFKFISFIFDPVNNNSLITQGIMNMLIIELKLNVYFFFIVFLMPTNDKEHVISFPVSIM